MPEIFHVLKFPRVKDGILVAGTKGTNVEASRLNRVWNESLRSKR